jgi:hypothetical protein
MLQFFGQMLKLPLEAFVYSMEMLVKTMRGMQQIAYQGIDMMADEVAQTLIDASGSESDLTSDATDGAIGDRAETTPQTSQEEERKMSDRDLRDDMLKLVRYKILFVKRDLEVVLKEDTEELVHDNIAESDYIGWKIAEFIQDLKNVDIPKKWRDKKYPRHVKDEVASKISRLPEEDKKYLRVYYEVLDRYSRERFKYEEKQIDVLEEIRDKLGRKVEVEAEQAEVLRQVRDVLGKPPESSS